MNKERVKLFFAASDYPMLGMADVIPNLSFVSLFGDGDHCFNPDDIIRNHKGDFTALSNNLLSSRKLKEKWSNIRPKPLAFFVMYNDETIRHVNELNFEFGHVSDELKQMFDNKIQMTEFAQFLGIPMVDHCIVWSHSPPPFTEIKQRLSDKVIVQHPFGSSAETTFYVDSDRLWSETVDRYRFEKTPLRISRYIDCFCLCVDACIVGDDTLVGPVMSEVNGNRELTVLRNSWCGNQVVHNELRRDEIMNVRDYVRKIGCLMAKKGFRGYFSADFLYDKNLQKAFFSEVNPRVSGGSTVANLTMHFAGMWPLIGHHIDQFLGEKTQNIDEQNDKISRISKEHFWSQIIFKNLEADGYVRKISKRGVLSIDNGIVGPFKEQHFSMPTTNNNIIYFTPEARVGDFLVQDSEIGSLLSLTPLYDAHTGQLTKVAEAALVEIKKTIDIGDRS